MKYDRSYDCNIECQFSCKNGNELWISYENGDILEEFRVFAFGERDNFLFDRLTSGAPFYCLILGGIRYSILFYI